MLGTQFGLGFLELIQVDSWNLELNARVLGLSALGFHLLLRIGMVLVFDVSLEVEWPNEIRLKWKSLIGFQLVWNSWMDCMEMLMGWMICDYFERVTTYKNETTSRESLPPKEKDEKNNKKLSNKRILSNHGLIHLLLKPYSNWWAMAH